MEERAHALVGNIMMISYLRRFSVATSHTRDARMENRAHLPKNPPGRFMSSSKSLITLQSHIEAPDPLLSMTCRHASGD
jgi:hypothetical protein